MKKYIFTYINDDHNGIFKDMTSEKAVGIIDFLPSHKKYSNIIMDKIEKICLSYKLNSRIKIPGQAFFYNLDNYPYEESNDYYMIMPTTSIGKFSASYLEKFKKRHKNVHLYAFVTDSMHASSPHMNSVREKLFLPVWDDVLTYDKYDADEFGFKWFGFTYYSSFDEVKADGEYSDLYYVGYDKGGRENIVNNIYNYMNSNGVKCRFDVVSKNTGKDFKYIKKTISYPEVVSRLRSSNCILEILQNNQKSQSVRYFEAVVYNKKLLTMNKNICELPYYDPCYMKVFDNVEEIDLEWVRDQQKPDYQYSNEFSPVNVINFINSLVN